MTAETRLGRKSEEDFVPPNKPDLSASAIRDLYFKMNGLRKPDHSPIPQHPRTTGARRV